MFSVTFGTWKDLINAGCFFFVLLLKHLQGLFADMNVDLFVLPQKMYQNQKRHQLQKEEFVNLTGLVSNPVSIT